MYFLRLTKACLFHEVFQGKVNFFFHFCISLDTLVPAHSRQALKAFFLLIQHLEKSEMLSYICFQNIQFVQNTTSKDYGQQMDTDTDKDRNTYSSPLSLGNTLHGPWWMPETVDGTKPYIYYIFPTHTYL